MTQDQLIESFSEATQMHIADAIERGLHPTHIANIQLLSAIQMMVALEGVTVTKVGLIRAAGQIGADNG